MGNSNLLQGRTSLPSLGYKTHLALGKRLVLFLVLCLPQGVVFVTLTWSDGVLMSATKWQKNNVGIPSWTTVNLSIEKSRCTWILDSHTSAKQQLLASLAIHPPKHLFLAQALKH